jgi:hypothetical protein
VIGDYLTKIDFHNSTYESLADRTVSEGVGALLTTNEMATWQE